ncbi:MAG: hypothetical protein EAZ57_04930 [Cytophagales bacterium]|nr:MAG: hypothetical protein EAZ67_00950 [Cytophagales bacterium]TAF61137.1 MAG: hypothetical protein EAZ57_04930 [Cytophagales bacterium]
MKQLSLGVLKIIGAILLVTMFACNSTNQTDAGDGTETGTDSTATNDPSVSPEVIDEIIQSIPSPLEVSMLIKSVEKEYRKDGLNSPKSADSYTTNYQKALNLGVYSTDLGYGNIYGKSQESLEYLNAVKRLADGLAIGQFFDYATIKRLAASNENIDSLLTITQTNFEKINQHLRQQKRESLSILILTGGWLEAVYLTAQVYNSSKDPKLKEKLGEQKLVLKQILLVLDIFKNQPNFNEIITDLNELDKIYNNINISVTKGQPKTTIDADGNLVFVSNDITTVTISDQDVDTITSLIKSIRGKIIKES